MSAVRKDRGGVESSKRRLASPRQFEGGRNVLIHRIEDDVHAASIAYALEQRGNRVFQWHTGRYPEGAAVSIAYEGGSSVATFRNGEMEFSPNDIDVVWFRRRQLPVAPQTVDARDRAFVTNELRVAAQAHNAFFNHAFWINRFESADFCDLKPRQFHLAQKRGLSIPRTLISNDPDEIKGFLGRTRKCIYKPLIGHVWSEEGRLRKTYTSFISQKQLPTDDLLRAVPGIFQEFVDKAYEARVQFFGNFYAGVRIDSSKLEEGHLDWRIGQSAIGACEPVTLPPDVCTKCRQLMNDLGIVSGGFDFIVNKKGEWIFMEVNEAGQFFFVEGWCQELPVVDAFCQFIESKDENFVYQPPGRRLTLKEVYLAAKKAGVVP
jgi:glutathione synthase/RimK-type ligase-like ATP-grasp enzyme